MNKPNTISSVRNFAAQFDADGLTGGDLRAALDALFTTGDFQNLLVALAEAPAFSDDFGKQFAAVGAVSAISPCRILRSAMNLSLERFFDLLGQLVTSLDATEGATGLATQ